jgi:hypothetical protein
MKKIIIKIVEIIHCKGLKIPLKEKWEMMQTVAHEMKQ